ncbi:hypothetical protein ATANTOWER_023911, partial [Ataeniobius toweri]|nr:hypothetical protein [Ataeniobius toweri]
LDNVKMSLQRLLTQCTRGRIYNLLTGTVTNSAMEILKYTLNYNNLKTVIQHQQNTLTVMILGTDLTHMQKYTQENFTAFKGFFTGMICGERTRTSRSPTAQRRGQHVRPE